MHDRPQTPNCIRAAMLIFASVIALAGNITAHPLGNFTVNHHVRIEVGRERISLWYVVDMAEIAALQELQRVDANADGTPSGEELNRYLEQLALSYLSGFAVTIDGASVPLTVVTKKYLAAAGRRWAADVARRV